MTTKRTIDPIISDALILSSQIMSDMSDAVGHSAVFHAYRVAHLAMRAGLPPVAVAAAALHDVLEDVPDTNSRDLTHYLRYGFTNGLPDDSLSEPEVESEIVRLVEILTHNPGEPYTNYIGRVAQDRWATAIKLCDIADNAHPDRIDFDGPEGLARRQKKYANALMVLEAAAENHIKAHS